MYTYTFFMYIYTFFMYNLYNLHVHLYILYERLYNLHVHLYILHVHLYNLYVHLYILNVHLYIMHVYLYIYKNWILSKKVHKNKYSVEHIVKTTSGYLNIKVIISIKLRLRRVYNEIESFDFFWKTICKNNL